MRDEEKTREQLLAENESLRAMFSELKKAESECKWVEAALRESEERYKRLLESITDYIYIVKVENGLPVSTTHGPGCLAVTGYASDYFQRYPNLWYQMIHEEDRKAVLNQVEKILSGEAVQPLEHRIIYKDGSIRWVRNTPVPHYDKDGNLISYDGLISDITERKMADEQLRTIFDNTTDGILLADIESKRFYIGNKRIRVMLGYSLDEIKALGVMDIHPEKDLPYVIDQFERQAMKEFTIAKDIPVKRKDGSVFYADINSSPVTLGKKTYLLGIFRDITERKEAEEAMRASREYARNIIESSMDMIIAVDNDRRIAEFNKAAQETFGYALEEVLGKHVDMLYADPSEGLMSHNVTMGNGRHLQEIVNRRKNGELFPSLLSASILQNAQGDMVGLMGISHDITRRKRDEEALKESFANIERAKKEWEATFDGITDPLFIHDKDFKIVRANRAYADAAGIDFKEIVGKPYYEVFPKMDGPFRMCLKAQELQEAEEEEFSCPVTNRIFKVRFYPIKDANGGYLYSIHILEDITEAKRAEEKIKKLSQSVEQSPSIVMITDVKGNIEYVNPKFTEITGYTSKEIIGTNAGDLGMQSPEEYRQMWDTIVSGREWRGTFHNKKKSGEYFWESASISAVKNQKGVIINFIKVAEDITERKRSEERQKALYEFSQMIVSSLDLDFRLRSVCQAVSEMGYKMAWIGTLKEDTKDVIPRAQAGFENGYLSSIKVKFDDSPLGQGPTGRAIKGKRPEIQNHIGTDPRYEPWRTAALEMGYGSSSAFPIIDKNNVIAILNVYHTEDEFPQRDVDFLQTFANQTAAYIKNAQLFGEVKETADSLRQEMEVTSHLLMIAEATSHTTDIDKLMGQVVHCGHEIAKFDICLSYLWDSETRLFKPCQAVGLSHNMTPLFKTESLDMKVGLVKESMKGKKPIIVAAPFTGAHDAGIKPAATFDWLPDINTLAVIPLIGKKGPLGLIVGVYTDASFMHRQAQHEREKAAPPELVEGQSIFTERDMKIMQGIMHQVSVALDEAKFYKESIDKAMELSHQIETVQTMHEIDRSILSTLEPQEILETAARMVARLMPCDRVTVALVDREKKGFVYAGGFGITAVSKGGLVPFEDTSATEVAETHRAQFVSNLSETKGLRPLEEKLLNEGFLSHIRVPLTIKDEVVGVLNVGAKRPSAFSPEDLSTLEKMAAQAGVALSNAKLISDMEELFLGTVKSLSTAIDAKSPWTAGHSERVTKYALDIAKEMGFDRDKMRSLELAGLLHDIGKIGTYDFLLDKPGKLEPDEIEMVRLHPGKGAEILEPIKRFGNIIPAIRHHHEFYDGTGYPDRLKGEDIPFLARILAVADTYDAMKADRPYRPGRTMEFVLEEFRRCSGTQFDPKVVEAFLKVIEEKEEFKTAAS